MKNLFKPFNVTVEDLHDGNGESICFENRDDAIGYAYTLWHYLTSKEKQNREVIVSELDGKSKEVGAYGNTYVRGNMISMLCTTSSIWS